MSFTAQEELKAHMQQPEAAEVARPAVVISCSNAAFWRALLKTRFNSGEAAGLQILHSVLHQPPFQGHIATFHVG